MAAAARSFVGLAAVDLGLRLWGLNYLTGMNVRLDEMLLWAEENGIGKILRSRLADTGLNRGQLAARLEVSETTVDNWLDGRNWPGREYVDTLGRELAGGDADRAGPLAAQLRRQFVLATLCHLLVEHLEWDYVYSAKARPDYALAYRYGAHYAFRSGDGVKGRDYAKSARRLGGATEFDAWQRGDYRGRRP